MTVQMLLMCIGCGKLESWHVPFLWHKPCDTAMELYATVYLDCTEDPNYV